MGFGVFMLLTELLIPAGMIGFGLYFLKGGPKNVNGAFGYRTTLSMKNQETWKFAHKYSGKIWLICGITLVPLTVLSMLLVRGKDVDTIGCLGLAVVGVQLVLMVGVILPTERALKKHFGSEGKRR